MYVCCMLVWRLLLRAWSPVKLDVFMIPSISAEPESLFNLQPPGGTLEMGSSSVFFGTPDAGSLPALPAEVSNLSYSTLTEKETRARRLRNNSKCSARFPLTSDPCSPWLRRIPDYEAMVSDRARASGDVLRRHYHASGLCTTHATRLRATR